MDATTILSKEEIKIMEEYLVVQEFRNSFKKKFGYEPLVFTKNIKGKTIDSLPFMSLEEIIKCFDPFLPVIQKEKVKLSSQKRTRTISELRYMFYRISRSMGYTLKEIGNEVHKRDHTTVIHGLKMFKTLYQIDDLFREKFTVITNYIKEHHINNYESSIVENSDKLPDQSKPSLFPLLLPE